ncbi:osmotic-shock protein [Pacificimonas flava]|uniref:Osmotic-shock protein n=2 Tax=Pacificimonas TaxID=1960290 RepID=A0A219B8Z5_9SPHN|nr:MULTISPECIES: YggT family protein [Pacificimonas]MBZ6377413.1 YggT family protein [Pacificimonas aurantium]OWV34644.1 osmotic-shock protein [Pacificimonas flava]
MALALINILQMLLQVGIWIVIAQVVLSWLIAFNVVNMSNNFVRSIYYGIERILGPVYRPIRRLMPDLGGLDLTPMVVILGFIAAQELLKGVASQILGA